MFKIDTKSARGACWKLSHLLVHAAMAVVTAEAAEVSHIPPLVAVVAVVQVEAGSMAQSGQHHRVLGHGRYTCLIRFPK